MSKTLHIIGDSFCCDFDWWTTFKDDKNTIDPTEEYNNSHQWINIVKNNLGFDEVKNHSQAGCSMYYHSVKLNELIRNNEIKKDDKVIIGLSSIGRIQHPYKLKTGNVLNLPDIKALIDFKSVDNIETIHWWGVEMNAWFPIVLYQILTFYKINFCFSAFLYTNQDSHFSKTLKNHPINDLTFGLTKETDLRNYISSVEENYFPTHLDKEDNKKLGKDLTKFLEKIW